MSKVIVGELITGEATRDAIHVPTFPAYSWHTVLPGEKVILSGGKNDKGFLEVTPENMGGHIGVVDPFLTREVPSGEAFHVFVIPGTTSDLHHEWTHPGFPATPKKRTLIDYEEDYGERGRCFSEGC